MKSLIRRPKVLTATILAVSAIVVAALIASPPLLAQQRGRCAVTEIPGHLVLPDGRVSEANELKICFEDWHHPGSGRHVIFVDGRQWGYLLSRSGESKEFKAEVPLFVFTPRTEHHHVRLLGYAWPDRDGMSVHVLHLPGRKVARSLTDPSSLLERADAERYVLATARTE
jgi:hypothetical protein